VCVCICPNFDLIDERASRLLKEVMCSIRASNHGWYQLYLVSNIRLLLPVGLSSDVIAHRSEYPLQWDASFGSEPLVDMRTSPSSIPQRSPSLYIHGKIRYPQSATPFRACFGNESPCTYRSHIRPIPKTSLSTTVQCVALDPTSLRSWSCPEL
jgi:hypothetical protein